MKPVLLTCCHIRPYILKGACSSTSCRRCLVTNMGGGEEQERERLERERERERERQRENERQ